jgi:predicted DsbA family dithiol-disulfide isomerase
MPIKITIYSDFVCPFCYVSAGIVDAFKNEFDIEETWVPHEIHPDTPTQGRPMTELVSQFDIDHITEVLRQRGKPYGIKFGDMTLLSNSRRALETGEFARDHGSYHRVHMALFKAYFTDGKDIGDTDVLKSVVRECGLDPDALFAALEEERYSEQVREGSAAAGRAGVTAIPTFLIQDLPAITGAVNETVFREILQLAANALQGL